MSIRNVISLLLVIVFAAAGHAGEVYIHGVSDKTVSAGALSYKKMSARLDYDAVAFREYAPVPRIAENDTAFAADAEEYEKLNSYGVIMISAQCQNPDELPLKSVYLKISGKKYPLTCLLKRDVPTGSEISSQVLGSNRMDSFYLIPYGYTKLKGELCIDWGTNREGFITKKFPASLNLNFVKDGMSVKPVKGRKIDRDSLKEFLKREYSFSEEDAAEAVKALVNTNY